MTDPFPPGSVFLSLVNTDPSSSLGYGIWSRIGQGRFLVGVDEGIPQFNTGSLTGGSDTFLPSGTIQQALFTGTPGASTAPASAGTPTGFFSGSVSLAALAPHSHSFSGSPLAAHSHETPIQLPAAGPQRFLNASVFGTGSIGRVSQYQVSGTANVTTASVALTSTSSAGTPAGTVSSVSAGTPSGTISGSVAGTPMASHFHNLPVPSGTINAQSFAGIASSSLPPYLTVYMWARTS